MRALNQIKAGAGQVDITPTAGTRINGDFVTHFATRIHDPLYAKCLILQNDHEIVTWVIVDICTMSQAFMDEVKSRIFDRTHIPVRNIMMASTHTHAAGAIEEVHLSALDLAYRERLAILIPKAVVKAVENLRPAEVTWGSVDIPDHVLCRRYYLADEYKPINPVTGAADVIKTNPFGLENLIKRPVAEPDTELSYLAVRDCDGQWISVMANYSLHYVGDWENGTISADYYGVFAESIRQNLDAADDFVGIMTNGTSGDINIWDFEGRKDYPTAPFAKSRVIGEDIARQLAFDLELNSDWQRICSLAVRNETLSVEVRKPNVIELATARSVVEQSDYENFEYSDAGLNMVYAREQLLLHDTPDTRTIPLQAIRIENLLIGALPGEFFAETGLALKDSARDYSYFTIGLANGNVGYVPPAHEIDRGGYETWRCRYSCLESDSESIIRNEMIRMLHSFSDLKG